MSGDAGVCPIGPAANPANPAPSVTRPSKFDIGTSFAEGFSSALAGLGITEPFAVQRMCIPPALAGEDVIAKSPTGSGKTLAFGLPLVMRADPSATAPEALVLCPTRELAQQIAEDLEPLAKA